MRPHPSATPSAWPIAGGHVSVALVVGTLAFPAIARHVADLVRGLSGGRHRLRVYVLDDDETPGATRLRALGVPLIALS